MPFVYILYSALIDKYYVGYTNTSVEERLTKHNSNYYDNKWTKTGIPWVVYFQIECSTTKQAILIERHIKKMKSVTYLKNIKAYPQISQKLLEKYFDSMP